MRPQFSGRSPPGGQGRPASHDPRSTGSATSISVMCDLDIRLHCDSNLGLHRQVFMDRVEEPKVRRVRRCFSTDTTRPNPATMPSRMSSTHRQQLPRICRLSRSASAAAHNCVFARALAAPAVELSNSVAKTQALPDPQRRRKRVIIPLAAGIALLFGILLTQSSFDQPSFLNPDDNQQLLFFLAALSTLVFLLFGRAHLRAGAQFTEAVCRAPTRRSGVKVPHAPGRHRLAAIVSSRNRDVLVRLRADESHHRPLVLAAVERYARTPAPWPRCWPRMRSRTRLAEAVSIANSPKRHAPLLFATSRPGERIPPSRTHTARRIRIRAP